MRARWFLTNYCSLNLLLHGHLLLMLLLLVYRLEQSSVWLQKTWAHVEVIFLFTKRYGLAHSYRRQAPLIRCSARDAFVKTNRGPIVMIFVRLSVCPSVRPSVCLSGTSVQYDHTMHFNADLSIRVDSPIFWAPWQQSTSMYSKPSFASSMVHCSLGRDLEYGCAN